MPRNNNVRVKPNESSLQLGSSDSPPTSAFRMESVVSNVLRYGVVASFVIVAVGAAMLLLSLHAEHSSWSFAALMTVESGRSQVPRSSGGVLRGLLVGDPNAVIALGLVVLLATPILRVAISVLVFLFERDWLYVAITLFVLAMLGVSFLVGTAG